MQPTDRATKRRGLRLARILLGGLSLLLFGAATALTLRSYRVWEHWLTAVEVPTAEGATGATAAAAIGDSDGIVPVSLAGPYGSPPPRPKRYRGFDVVAGRLVFQSSPAPWPTSLPDS